MREQKSDSCLPEIRPRKGQSCLASVRVKDGMNLRNGMWHGLRNVIIVRNTIYEGNKLADVRIMFSRQFCKSSSFFDAADSSRILNI